MSNRRARIIQACMEELRGNGFPNVRVEDVAKRAGLDKKTLYDYIECKEDLLLLVFGEFLGPMLHAVREARDSEKDDYRQLYAMLATSVKSLADSPHFVLFMYREVRYLKDEDRRTVLGMINDIHSEYSRVFAGIMKLQVNGWVQNPVLSASSALTLIDMLGLHSATLGRQDPEAFTHHVFRLSTGLNPSEAQTD